MYIINSILHSYRNWNVKIFINIRVQHLLRIVRILKNSQQILPNNLPINIEKKKKNRLRFI